MSVITTKNDIKHWQAICRSQALRPGQLIKEAELGGGQDQPFEQAFSNLAHAYIRDKAPKLLDMEVGFQLIEKNQENTKAIGVFGFKVGSQWIYVPVFFLNGDLKGHELMYIKSQDQFLPLKENWVNHILGKKPSILGDGVNRNLSMLGIMPPNLYQLSRSPYKFASDNNPVKLASWAAEFLPVLGYLVTTPPVEKYKDMKGLPDLIKEGGEDLLRVLVEKVGTQYPAIIQGIDTIYGPELLNEAAQQAAKLRKSASSNSLVKEAVVSSAGEHPKGWNGGIKPPSKRNGGVRSDGEEAWSLAQEQDGGLSRRFENKHGGAMKGKLSDMYKHGNYPGCGMSMPRRPKKMAKKKSEKKASIIPSVVGPLVAGELKHKVVSREMVDNDPNIVHSLKSDEREKLLKERVVFSDKREGKDVTIAYDVQTPMRLYNPDHTDVYYVLCRPDKFVKCLVIMGPHSSKQRHNFCTVVRLDGQKDYTNTHPANVWVRAELDRDAFTKWLKEQPEADSIPLAPRKESWKYRTRHVLLGPSGQGSCPFMATEKYTGKENEQVSYDVDWENHNYSQRPAYLPDHSAHLRDSYEPCCGHMINEQLVLTKRPGIKLTALRGQLLVPAEFKLIKVQDEKDPNGSNNEPLQLGNLLDAQMAIMANTQPLRIVMDGSDVKVDENRKMDKKSALVHLFRDHGLSEKTATHLVEKAAKQGKVECRVLYPDYIQQQWDLTEKAADGDDMIRGAPNAPAFPEPYWGYDPMTGGNVPTMQPSEFNVKIPDMSASKTDRSIFYPFGPDPKAMQVAQQASQKGQREVFDTAALGGLLKAVRQDNIVDKYMGDLKKGLDRLGRLLFLCYWHGEEFEDRYGKQDMPELEDGLRNGFENVGDIVLKLMQKSVEASPDEGTGVDLGPIANQ